MAHEDVDSVLYYMGIPTLLRRPHDPDPSHCDVALAGVPWSGGNPRERGQFLGPRAVRHVSPGAPVNRATRVKPYELCRVHDVGDAPLPNLLSPDRTMLDIAAFYGRLCAAGARPLSVGGDHSISLPILRGVQMHPAVEGPVALVHFDAHTDTLPAHFGSEFHCGAPFRLAVEERLVDPRRSLQVGIRGVMVDEGQEDWAREQGFRVMETEEFDRLGPEKVIAEIREVVGEGPVYLSFDLDVLDPVFAPGVAVPEPNGLALKDVTRVLHGLRGLDLIGADLVCMVPDRDPTGVTALHAAFLLFEFTCLAAEAVAARRAEPAASAQAS